MDIESNYIIEECRFCGNKTKLDIVAQYNITDEEYYFDELRKKILNNGYQTQNG